MSRKTFDVRKFVDLINRQLAVCSGSADIRLGVISVAEQVLSETDNYKGFRYLHQNEMEFHNQLPGINGNSYDDILPFEERFVNTDNTRRSYY